MSASILLDDFGGDDYPVSVWDAKFHAYSRELNRALVCLCKQDKFPSLKAISENCDIPYYKLVYWRISNNERKQALDLRLYRAQLRWMKEHEGEAIPGGKPIARKVKPIPDRVIRPAPIPTKFSWTDRQGRLNQIELFVDEDEGYECWEWWRKPKFGDVFNFWGQLNEVQARAKWEQVKPREAREVA